MIDRSMRTAEEATRGQLRNRLRALRLLLTAAGTTSAGTIERLAELELRVRHVAGVSVVARRVTELR